MSRELSRNCDASGRYRATTAHARAYDRASRPKPAKLVVNPVLRARLEADLANPLLAVYYSQLGQTTIAWSDATTVDSGAAYLRVDGPRVWIEWLNSSAAGGLHHHTLYRDKALDYGTGLG